MKQHSRIRSCLVSGAWMVCALSLVGCERSTQVGSGCVDGVCPQTLSREDVACIVTADAAQVSTADGEEAILCLITPLLRDDDGSVQARVLYQLSAESGIECTDKPYLRPVGGELRESHLREHPGGELCELNQLAVIESDGGAPTVASGDGFYYDDFSQEAEEDCGSSSAGRVVINVGARAWDAESVIVSTTEARGSDGSAQPELVCNPQRGSEPVGTPCLPAQRYYDRHQVILETRSEACGDGVCMAHHLEGDTDASCNQSDSDANCAAPEQIEQRAHCTCRCDAPPGSADACECPDDFLCVDLVSLRDDVAGSYCVKEGPM